MDRIFTVLSGKESFDVKVKPSPLYPNFVAEEQTNFDNYYPLYGTLSHPLDKISISLLEILTTRREKDAITEFAKKILEVVTKERLPFTVAKVIPNSYIR